MRALPLRWSRWLLPVLLTAAVLLGLAGAYQTVRRSTPVTSDAPALVALHGLTMGSSYSVRYLVPTTLESSDQGPTPEQVQATVQRVLSNVNALWSTWQTDSELSRFNAARSTDWIAVSSETVDLVEQSMNWTELSHGGFDLSIAPLVNLWGFGPRGRARHTPTEQALAAARAHVGISKLQIRRSPPALRKLDPELELDLSACAAGVAADRVSSALTNLGFEHHYVEIAGEISVRGSRASDRGWQIGIEHPQTGDRKLLMSIELHDESIATSGNYRNAYVLDDEKVAHTLDANTGRPVTHQTISATVIDPSCGTADALATLLMTLPTAEALQLANQQGWTALLVELRDGEYHLLASAKFEQRFRSSLEKLQPVSPP